MAKQRHIPRFLSVFLFALALFGTARIYYFLTDGFRISGITHLLEEREDWDIKGAGFLSTEEVQPLLNQPFHYLGKGAQCYVFESEDREYVVKFFKFKHLRPAFFMRALPEWGALARLKETDRIKKRERLESVFNGYTMAASTHPQHAQVVYFHLTPKEPLQQQLHITDKMGWSRTIDLDTTHFLVQKKGKILRQVLREQIQEKGIEGAKEALTKIIKMYLEEYRSGMYDHDHGVMYNTGFVAGEPFHLDLGKFCREETMTNPTVHGEDLGLVMYRIDEWLEAQFPAHREELMGYLSSVYREEMGRELDLVAAASRAYRQKLH